MTDAAEAQGAETLLTTPEEQLPVGEPTQAEAPPAEQAAEQSAETVKEAEAPQGAPESYAAFEMPEGATIGDSVLSKFSEAAKSANLPQDAAQRILSEVAPAIAAEQAAALASLSSEWAASSRADKEFGGDKFDENLGIAQQAMTKFATPELSKLLKDTALGNHPEVLRLFNRIGKAFAEDKVIAGNGAPAPTTADRLATLYDNTPKS